MTQQNFYTDAPAFTYAEMLALPDTFGRQTVFVTDNWIQDIFTFDGQLSEWKNPNYSVMENNSGGTLVLGDVVILDRSGAARVTTTTTEGNNLVWGGVVIGANDGSDLLIKRAGKLQMNKRASAFTAQHFIITYTTVKVIETTLGGGLGVFGITLEDAAIGAPTVLCYLGMNAENF